MVTKVKRSDNKKNSSTSQPDKATTTKSATKSIASSEVKSKKMIITSDVSVTSASKRLKHKVDDKNTSTEIKKRTRPESPAPTLKKAKKNQPTNAQVKLAVDALLQHVELHNRASREKTKKLPLPGVDDDESDVYLQVGFRKMPIQATKTFKGYPIKLPNPFRLPKDGSAYDICMIVKDKSEAKKWLGEDYKEKHGLAKMLSLQQVRKEYATYEQRRELAKKYDCFLADDRIVCMLPKALGKPFYSGPKRPLPIRLAYKNKLKGDTTTRIRHSLDCAYFYLSGMSSAVRIGTTNMSAEELVDNVMAVVEGAVEKIPGQWKGVQNMFIKSSKSAALPIFEAVDAEDVEIAE